jgi:hypothetical protein
MACFSAISHAAGYVSAPPAFPSSAIRIAFRSSCFLGGHERELVGDARPSTIIWGSSDFGAVTSLARETPPRVIQLGAEHPF